MRYLYCIFTPFSFRLVGRFKIGITSNMKARREQISTELGGVKLYHFSLWVLYPEKMEKRLHGLFARLRARVPYHRGHTEWFSIRNYAAACVYLLWSGHSGEAAAAWVVALIFMPVPFDGFMAVLAVFAFQVAGVAALIYIAALSIGLL